MFASCSRYFHFAFPFALLLWVGVLSGCSVAGMAIGAGAGTAVAASEERGLGEAISDTTIRTKINYELLDKDLGLFRRVSTSVHEGRVLLMGIVPTDDAMTSAVKITWQVEGVREVINEMRVAPDTEFTDSVRDSWITAKLRTRIMLDKQVDAINYSIETIDRVIYLLGIAQNQEELDRVIRTARDIEYVEKIVSHVLLKNDPRRKAT
ncbi:MAG: BON domain-containing protein [Alphaproteobacteria bacterium]|nr:BON domain-containing protein [Alphaproteobacteria bacterium]